MKINLGETNLRINISFAAVITAMLILDESGYCAIGLFCCAVHEAAHIVCLLFQGEKPRLVELSYYGVKLERNVLSGVSGINDIIVFLSGPAVNIAMAALLCTVYRGNEKIATAAAISFFTGAFNLLPCRPLDGGNILYAVLCRNTSERKAEKICFTVLCAVLLPLSAAGFTLMIKYRNITLLPAALYITAVSFFDKKEKGSIKL